MVKLVKPSAATEQLLEAEDSSLAYIGIGEEHIMIFEQKEVVDLAVTITDMVSRSLDGMCASIPLSSLSDSGRVIYFSCRHGHRWKYYRP